MEERIEEVTTFTSDDELRDNDILEYECTRRVPFPEFGMDIVDRESLATFISNIILYMRNKYRII